MSNDNPLRSYFRRPALYLKLPSKGAGYTNDIVEMTETGEIPIFPMTAIDEITARTPDALFNGIAVAEIIKSCAPNIKNPWKLQQVDLDPLLLSIKIATHGNTTEIQTKCPECSEEEKYDVNLTKMLNEFTPGDYSKMFSIDDVQIKFKPLTYKKVNEASQQQFDVQRAMFIIQSIENEQERDAKSVELIKEMNEMAMSIILDTIEFVKTPEATVLDRNYIHEFLVNIPIKDYEKIRNYTIELKQTTEAKPLHFKCQHCSHEYDQPFNVNASDFFG
jgi:hypothetical protein